MDKREALKIRRTIKRPSTLVDVNRSLFRLLSARPPSHSLSPLRPRPRRPEWPRLPLPRAWRACRARGPSRRRRREATPCLFFDSSSLLFSIFLVSFFLMTFDLFSFLSLFRFFFPGQNMVEDTKALYKVEEKKKKTIHSFRTCAQKMRTHSCENQQQQKKRKEGGRGGKDGRNTLRSFLKTAKKKNSNKSNHQIIIILSLTRCSKTAPAPPGPSGSRSPRSTRSPPSPPSR